MAIDFEKFLNEALGDDTTPKDILDISDEEVDYEDVEEVRPIQITPLIDQIQNLHSQAYHSPEIFKEVYEKLEDFEKNFPQYLLDVQNKFYEAQGDLKEKYLTSLEQSHISKLEKVKAFMQNQFELIKRFIIQKDFEKAHIYLQQINVEIAKIPQSHMYLKNEFLMYYNALIKEFYFELENNEDSLIDESVNKITEFISNKKIFTSMNRRYLEGQIQDVQKFLSEKRLELDITLKDHVKALNSYYLKLIEYRKKVEDKYLEELKIIIKSLSDNYNFELNKRNLYKSLITLEMIHILLKKETKYNQNLKISEFVNLLNKKQQLNQLSFSKKKALTDEELHYAHLFSKIQLVKLLKHSILRFDSSEIESIKSEITTNHLLSESQKERLLNQLQLESLKSKSLNSQKMTSDEKTTFENQEIKRVKDNITQLYQEFVHEVKPSLKIKKKYELIRYIKLYIKQDRQEKMIAKVNAIALSVGGD